MSTRTKILIASLAALIIVIVVAVYLSTKNNNSAQAPVRVPDIYQVSINANSQSYTAEVSTTTGALAINSADLGKFVIISYNNPHDILWAVCPNSYELTNASSNNNAKIINNPGVGAQMVVNPKTNSNITITCNNQ